ncbi:uncharacterized protein B0T23DRAFT_419768 [Neurospora hispaniola]|uniref:Uncharacterized protein n=1 Tax=Neurospora hispaniola TaxID=588809 RepID=A0AAJ0IAY5_9PEZI|nr:hypothetical protein B0T23DRAFT_419768 [Neurospora hispaniola]
MAETSVLSILKVRSSEQQIDHVHHRTWLPKLCKAEATAESSQAEASSSDPRGRRRAEVGAGELEGQVKPETLEASLVSLPARGGAIHRNPAHITCRGCFLECSRFPDRPGFLVESPSCLACPAPPFPESPLAITSSPPPIAGLLDLESCRHFGADIGSETEEACEGFCGLQSGQEFPALEDRLDTFFKRTSSGLPDTLETVSTAFPCGLVELAGDDSVRLGRGRHGRLRYTFPPYGWAFKNTRVSAVPTYLAHDVADIAPSEKHDLLEIRSGGLYKRIQIETRMRLKAGAVIINFQDWYR